MSCYRVYPPKKNKKGAPSQRKSNTFVKVICGIPQIREIDRRHETRDFQNGQGLNPPNPNKNNLYCYANQFLLNGDAEVTETFTNPTERLCMVDGNRLIDQISRKCFFDRRRNAVFYQFVGNEDGECQLCVKPPVGNARRFIDPLCLKDTKGKFFQFQTQTFPASTRRNRLQVKESCNAVSVPTPDDLGKNAKDCRNLVYEARRAHNLGKTKFICNKRPIINRLC